jgi:tetratricopeptide (TPR) repeat protein
MSMHLAAVYGLRESWKKAEAALEHTLAIFDANQMQEEQYAEVYSQLGEVYMKTQRYEEGEKACRRALELFRKHPPSRETRAHIGLCMQNLGLIKAKLEQLEEAERFLEKAVEIFSRTFESAIDPITVTASVRLAAVRLDRQDVPGAQAVLVPLAEAVQRLAPGRAGVPYLNLLVTIYTDRQLHEHAEPLLRRCIQLLEPPQDRRDRILVLSLRFDLVCLLRESGRAAEADALQEQLRSACAHPTSFSSSSSPPPFAFVFFLLLPRLRGEPGSRRRRRSHRWRARGICGAWRRASEASRSSTSWC